MEVNIINTAKLAKSLRLGHSCYATYEECEANLRYLRSKEEFDIYEIARCLNVSSSFIRDKFKKHGLTGERKPRKGNILTTYYSKDIVNKLIEVDDDLRKRVEIMKGDFNKMGDKFSQDYKLIKYRTTYFRFGSSKNYPACMEAYFEYLGQIFYLCACENEIRTSTNVKIASMDNCDNWPEPLSKVNFITQLFTNHTVFFNTQNLQDIIESFIKTLNLGIDLYRKNFVPIKKESIESKEFDEENDMNVFVVTCKENNYTSVYEIFSDANIANEFVRKEELCDYIRKDCKYGKREYYVDSKPVHFTDLGDGGIKDGEYHLVYNQIITHKDKPLDFNFNPNSFTVMPTPIEDIAYYSGIDNKTHYLYTITTKKYEPVDLIVLRAKKKFTELVVSSFNKNKEEKEDE